MRRNLNFLKSIKLLALAILGFALFTFIPAILLGISLVGNSPTVGNDAIKELSSPNGTYKAYAFVRDGGATTSYSPQVSILKKSKSLGNRSGNIFIGYRSQYVDIKWEDDSTLVISYDCSEEEVSKKVTEFHGVKIRYEKKTSTKNQNYLNQNKNSHKFGYSLIFILN